MVHFNVIFALYKLLYITCSLNLQSDIGTIMNKDVQYEVIDECTGEKTPETVENARTEDVEDTCSKTDNTTQQQEPETNTGTTKMQLKCCI